MEKRTISIVIPVYNSKEKIIHLLEKIAVQIDEACECIIVDDGSTDDTYDKCRAFVDVHKGFLLYSKPNGGVSTARNFGLRMSCGEWISFIDSDDSITDDYIQSLHEMVSNVDLVVFGHFRNEKYIPFHNRLGKGRERLGKIQFVEKDEQHLLPVWNKLYRMDVIRDNNIQFPENIHIGEDYIFNLNYLTCCQFVAIHKKALYYYCWDKQGGLSRKHYNIDITLKTYLLILELYHKLHLNERHRKQHISSIMKRMVMDVYLNDKLEDYSQRESVVNLYKKKKNCRVPIWALDKIFMLFHYAKKVKQSLF